MRASHRLVASAFALSICSAVVVSRADTANETPPAPAHARSRELKLILLADMVSFATDAPLVGAHVGAQLGRWFSVETGVDTVVPLRNEVGRAPVLVPLQAWIHLGPDEHTIDFGGGPEVSTDGGGAFYRTGLVYRYARAPGGVVVRAGVDVAWVQASLFGSSSWFASGLVPHLSVGWRL